MNFKYLINNAFRQVTGYQFSKPYSFLEDSRLNTSEKNIFSKVASRTMTNPNSIANLIAATKYVNERNLKGAFVECGVWRGGSAMAFCLSSLEQGIENRDLYLLDTYEGFSQVDEKDFEISNGKKASELLKIDANYLCYANLDDVKLGMQETEYPADKIHYLVGDVVKTDLASLPKEISILRLDTDYYDSTKWELENLFPRLVSGGVLIIDDYDHWNGCRQACDEFFQGKDSVFLIQMQYGRIMIKNG
jgi:O-methyltransferase